MEEFRVVLVLESLNLFYTIEDDSLFFNGYKTYANLEQKSLRRQFGIGDEIIGILKEWCILNGMTDNGWVLSNIPPYTGLEGGYIYAPYIPLQITEPIIHENDHQPINGLLSRYATRQIENRFYGEINIVDL